MLVEANVARIVNERVTSACSHTKEDLALLKRKNPLGYLTSILEGRESSSDQSASTASGKSTSTSPLEEALQKVKAQLFKRDLMLTLEGNLQLLPF